MVRGGVVVKEGGLGARLAPWDTPKRGTPPPPALSHSLGEADEILVVGVDVGELNVDQQQDLRGGRVSGGGEVMGLGGGFGSGGNSRLGEQRFGMGGGDQEEGGVGSGMGALGLWVGIWGRELGGCRWGSGRAVGGGLGGAAGGRLGAHRAEGRAVGGHRGAVCTHLVLGSALALPDVRGDDALRLLPQAGVRPELGAGRAGMGRGGAGGRAPSPKGGDGGRWGGGTLLVHCLTVLMSSWITRSTHLRHGSFSFTTCFFTMASNARSGVNSPVLGAKGGQRVSGRPTSEPPTSPPSSPHPQPPPHSHVPDAVDVLDGVADLPPQVLLVELHLSGHHSAPISAR